MTVLPAPMAALNRDGTRFVMARGAWRSSWMPIAMLPEQIKLYENLRDRGGETADPKTRRPAKPGPRAAVYAPWVEALRAIERKLKEMKA